MKHKIRVTNKYQGFQNGITINIMRPGIFGNPFPLVKENNKWIQTRSNRDEVVAKHKEYLLERFKNDPIFRMDIIKIREACEINDVNLECCCYPKACHGDNIKELLESISTTGDPL